MLAQGGSIQLFRIFGIRVGASPSWLIVLFLFIYLLSGSFRDALGGDSESQAYLVAVAAALLFFVSVIVHELGHALAARREGIGIAGIDLWFFGGIARFDRDSESPGEEFRVAVAGPLGTVLVVLLCFGASAALGGLDRAVDQATLQGGVADSPAELLLAFVGGMNVLILAFNLVPAYPLDGGRIARAAAWALTKDRNRATRISAYLGQGFGWLLIGLGAYEAFADDDPFNGIWIAVIGWLIVSSARSAVTVVAFAERLEGITVADVMDREPVAMPASTTLLAAEEEFFARYGWDWFPVVDEGGRLLGLALRARVREAVDAGRPALEVREVVEGTADDWAVGADQPLEAARGSQSLRSLGAVMAVDGEGVLRGVLTAEQLRRALTAATPGRAA